MSDRAEPTNRPWTCSKGVSLSEHYSVHRAHRCDVAPPEVSHPTTDDATEILRDVYNLVMRYPAYFHADEPNMAAYLGRAAVHLSDKGTP